MNCVSIAAGEVEFCSGKVAELTTAEAVVRFREEQVSGSSDAQLNVWIRARHEALDPQPCFCSGCD